MFLALWEILPDRRMRKSPLMRRVIGGGGAPEPKCTADVDTERPRAPASHREGPRGVGWEGGGTH